ncbi:hypothetical protein [Pandoraea terrae]|uniref:hypothetical protein n=1 Tax=Pandoraea terrae TaxID=1537710 RepID=UPI001240F05D|nr:hypothetical protein [Pandoraea terrae]
MSPLEALITSPPDRESVVYEIWHQNQQVAEISKEPGRKYEVEIYPCPDGGAWHLDLNEFKALLEDGVRRLASNP